MGRKRRRKILYILLSICLIGTITVGCIIAPTVFKGYQMYKNATQEVDLDTKVKEIRANENYVTLDQIPQEYLTRLIQSEDKRFYSHHGIDYIATARAMYNNVKARAFKEGGSTITQQLAKNLYFSFEKKLERKVAELFVVQKLEKKLTKNEILELYCNIIYFGENCYGIKEAANHYYNKEPNELNEEQIKALVYTIKSPNHYNPNAEISYALQ